MTGDNSLTAASVAKQCGLLAVDRPVYRPLVLPEDVAQSICMPDPVSPSHSVARPVANRAPVNPPCAYGADPNGAPQIMWARVDEAEKHIQLTTSHLAVCA